MKNLTKVIVAAAAGIAAGTAIGILFAPEKGRKTRRNISRKSKKYLRKMNDKMNMEKLSNLKKEFGDQLDKINDKLKSLAGTA